MDFTARFSTDNNFPLTRKEKKYMYGQKAVRKLKEYNHTKSKGPNINLSMFLSIVGAVTFFIMWIVADYNL